MTSAAGAVLSFRQESPYQERREGRNPPAGMNIEFVSDMAS
jgi:hypothetical protein